jgi:FdhD protein
MAKLEPINKISCHRLSLKSGIISLSASEDLAIEEKPLTIIVPEIGSFTLLCTPTDLQELAVGFIYSEGIIESIADIIDIDCSKLDQLIISLKVKNFGQIYAKRNLIVTSGCGLCGKHNIDHILLTTPPCPNTLKISPMDITPLVTKILEKQLLFKQTGATHTAAIFDQNHNIIAMKEDLARHNALDKTIGFCLLNQINLASCGVFLSSRVSFEMVTKTARAGLELILAVSAPSALAIKAAEYWNITLCGFLRGDSGNIYTNRSRLEK